MTDQLKPTQADRDAAFNLARIMEPGATDWHHNILNGHLDGHSYVQAFARHRLSQSGNAERESGATSSAEFHQRRGRALDLIDWAINEYREFMLDDDYNAQGALDRIIQRLRDARPELFDPRAAALPASGAAIEQETLSREQSRDVGRERLLGLEWTEDGYSLRTPYDGDADGDGRPIVVGGDIVVTFADSDEGEEAREAFIATLTTDQSQTDRLREALEPFALMAREGLCAAPDANGYVTITTQADYFHAADAALSETRP